MKLPLPDNDQVFESLVRDVLRLHYHDPSIELFGRSGQSQDSIDGLSTIAGGVCFQAKFKDLKLHLDHKKLLKLVNGEMVAEVKAFADSELKFDKFIFATTAPNDKNLQLQAKALSEQYSITVEYWGWGAIEDALNRFSSVLGSYYYPDMAFAKVNGFERITKERIAECKTDDENKLNVLGREYYGVSDRFKLLLEVVSNNIDVANRDILTKAHSRINQMVSAGSFGSFWLVGHGGSGKSSLAMRFAVESAKRGFGVFWLDLENRINNQQLDIILTSLKLAVPSHCILVIDNPASNTELLNDVMRFGVDYCKELKILLVERGHRLDEIKQDRQAKSLYGFHNQQQLPPLELRVNYNTRKKVYDRLFNYLVEDKTLAAELKQQCNNIITDPQLVFVVASYRLFAELKSTGQTQENTHFKFDWHDYQTRLASHEIKAFSKGYDFIALLYLFANHTPFSQLCKVLRVDDYHLQQAFIDCFKNSTAEPIVVEEFRQDLFEVSYMLRAKHEIIAEQFFLQTYGQGGKAPNVEVKQYIAKLFADWIKVVDIDDSEQTKVLMRIFGFKSNRQQLYKWCDVDSLMQFLLHSQNKSLFAEDKRLQGVVYLSGAWYLNENGKPDSAIKCLQQLIALNPNDLQGHLELSKIYQQQKRWDKAELVLLESLAIDDKQLHPRTELGKIYQQQKRWDKAELVLLESLAIDDKQLHPRTELGKIYQQQKRWDEAEQVLLDLLKLDKDNLHTRTELGKIYQQQKQWDKAEQVLLDLLKLDKDNLHTRTELSKIYQQQKRWDEAEQVLLKCIELDPQGLHPRTELGKIYQKQKRWDKAELVLLDLLKLDENNVQGRTELGKIYQQQKQWGKAEQVLLDILAIDSSDLHTRTELGKIYQQQKRWDKAELVLLESLAIDDKQLHPRTELGKI